ncbi:hypothetical protein SAMN02745120_2490 [Acetoanaerobium noterae]|uniref:Uncharacterized protein n=1 Tax=Acetoanaerobium noterae TaxID=745369 RepID=A0A1T5CZU9_9FIRM|nr:hypothetical protein [Acetoanaerobium noterae]SKB64750.1 hypothetical protein SAMN02745120_2490 [Acetoanaerobium noterae]
MIGNKYLQTLFNYPDEDTSLNQLLEMLKYKDMKFIDSLINPVDIDLCSEEEIIYLTKISALIDYYLQMHNIKVPIWIRNEKLQFDKPYYHSKRISDFEKLKLQYSNPSPFRIRNVYFDLDGIERI